VRVFVSSTFGELAAERHAARSAIEQLRLIPVMFESGARPHPAQAVYRAFLDQSDVFVGIYWQSYGWVGPGMDVSGLEDEFRMAARMPRLVYVKRPAPEIEPGLGRMLQGIRDDGGLAYKAFANAGELRELLLNDLATLLSERFGDTGRAGPGSVVPVPVTALVGRDRDVAEVASLVSEEDHRLVVLAGTGGVGKTRLALAVLERTRSHWEGGVAFVSLSAVSDPSSVPEAIVSALGFVGQGREAPLDTLGRRLAGQHMLVVLDNFEQVLEAAPGVADLLQRAPRLHLLVTSRVVLRVRGEREWRVEPLGLLPTGADPAGTPAVRLFVDRIRDVQPGFELTSENAAAIVELCGRLDGLPLALELAATWTRLLTPQQLLQRLDERMARPGALVDLPGRQQTMAATIEWSYHLLPQGARQMLAQLTVLAAPFTEEAAEAVSGHDAVGATESLALLLDHNMIQHHAGRPDGEPAFAMLNVIQRFASERLENPDQTLGRLERYLLGVLERAAPDTARRTGPGAGSTASMTTFRSSSGGRRSASGRPASCSGGSAMWLLVRGQLRLTSELGRQIGSWPAGGPRGERDKMARDWLMVNLLTIDGQFAQAGALSDEILPDARRLEQPSRWALMLMVRALSRPYTAGGPARGEFEEALAVVREAGDPILLGYVLSHYGLFVCVDGDPARAQGLHEEMLGITRSLGDGNQRAEAHYDLAMDAVSAGDPGSAGPHLAAAARRYTDIDHRDGLARCFGALAAVALQREHTHLAAWLVGATAAARVIGLTPWPSVAEAEGRVIERIRAALPEAEFTAEVAAGRTYTAEAALARAWAALEDGANAEVKGAGG
jgi:predicted ATPase